MAGSAEAIHSLGRSRHPAGRSRSRGRLWIRGVLVVVGLWMAWVNPVLAWSDHAGLLWPVLRVFPQLTDATVRTESLEEFLRQEAEGLAALLASEEGWAVANLEHYPPRPLSLAFHADAADLRSAFLAAIRVNPRLPYGGYRIASVDGLAREACSLRFSDLSFLQSGEATAERVYCALEPGEAVSIAQVLAAASDEPDLGMDIGLFEDNGTVFGARYDFGEQPFGNPNLDYGSQAPFHMGFYHLDWLTRRFQPGLLKTYPRWRVSLYGALSRFAFATDHEYWGWRFAGWALHYIGDLTQPYHAQPLPGVSTPEALWLVVTGGTAEAVQLVSNRHGVLESYQYQRLRRALEAGQQGDPLLQALMPEPESAPWSELALVTDLARASVNAGADLDAQLEKLMPPRWVSDPRFEWIGSGEEAQIVDAVERHGGQAAIDALDVALARQLRRFAYYAHAWIQQVLAQAPEG